MSRMSEKKLCLVGHQVNKSQICMMMTKVLMKPHKWEMVLGETEGVSDGALCEPIKNRDDNKSVYEIAETGNSIGEKESDVGKEVVYGGASGEQIPNPHDMTKVLMKPHKWEMVLVKQKRCLMAH